MNMNHWYSGMTTLSKENYLNTVIHCIQQGPYSVLRTWRSHIANTTRVLVPRLNQNFRTFYTFFLIKYAYYTLKLTFQLMSYGLCTTVMGNFRKVKLLENVPGTTLHSTLSCNTILCSKSSARKQEDVCIAIKYILKTLNFLVFLFKKPRFY